MAPLPSYKSPLPWRKELVRQGIVKGQKLECWAILDANGIPVVKSAYMSDDAELTIDFILRCIETATDLVPEVEPENDKKELVGWLSK